jgi:hypothetical protein
MVPLRVHVAERGGDEDADLFFSARHWSIDLACLQKRRNKPVNACLE